jgi:hypothetical protein
MPAEEFLDVFKPRTGVIDWLLGSSMFQGDRDGMAVIEKE